MIGALGAVSSIAMLGYAVASDPTGSVYIDYGVVGVPETYVITRQGTIGRKMVGPVDPRDLAASLEDLIRLRCEVSTYRRFLYTYRQSQG